MMSSFRQDDQERAAVRRAFAHPGQQAGSAGCDGSAGDQATGVWLPDCFPLKYHWDTVSHRVGKCVLVLININNIFSRKQTNDSGY